MPTTHPDGAAALARAVVAARVRAAQAPPRLSLSTWADHYRVLSREASAEHGRWRTSRAPYLRAILDAISDPTVPQVVLMSSAQVGKSEVLLNTLGYYVHADPAPIMWVAPTISEAEQFSKTRIAPMFRDTPVLRGLVSESKSRSSGNTLLVKEFPGGHVTLVGANAPSGLAAKPIRVVLLDEVDRYPASAGTEGDPVALATRRTTTFWNRKIVMVSTPTVQGASRIEAAYLEGSQGELHVPCPFCAVMQPLEWRRADGSYGLVFPREDGGRGRYAETAYRCVACERLIPEAARPAMMAGHQWVHRYPDRAVKSFRLWAGYSPWASWASIVEEFDTVRNDGNRLRQFINTVVGESFDLDPRAEPHTLAARAEAWPEGRPEFAHVLTAGVDVQLDRLELVLVAHGADDRRASVAWRTIPGDPQAPHVWHDLWAALDEAGGVASVAIDTGYLPDHVFRAIDGSRWRGRLTPVKGVGGPGRPLVSTTKRRTRGERSGAAVLVSSDTGKDTIAAAVAITGTGAGSWRFSAELPDEYYEHLLAEVLETKWVGGRPIRAWRLRQGRRNDALDATIYALAAWAVIPRPIRDRLLQQHGAPPPVAAPAPEMLPPGFPAARVPRVGRGWVSAWR